MIEFGDPEGEQEELTFPPTPLLLSLEFRVSGGWRFSTILYFIIKYSSDSGDALML